MKTAKTQFHETPLERFAPTRMLCIALTLGALLLLPAFGQAQELEMETDLGDQEVTNTTAERHAPGPDLTLTGEVVDWKSDQLVVQTATGTEHLVVMESTALPENPDLLDTGVRVAVDFQRNDQGVPIAQAIRLDSGTVTEGEAIASGMEVDDDDLAPSGVYSNPTMADEDEGELLIQPDMQVDEDDLLADTDRDGSWIDEDLSDLDVELESDLDAEMDAMERENAQIASNRPSRLPATASNLPLMLLGGVAALAFALFLMIQRFRRDDRNRALARSIVSFESDRRIHPSDF